MKHRRIKLFISFCYWNILLLKNIILKLAGREIPGRCSVIYYHSVKDKEKKQFTRQMYLLKRIVHTLRADYFGKLQNGKNYVILTFDDGFKCFLKNALPELLKFEFPCTVFFPVKYLGGKPEWENNKRFSDENEEIMTSAEVKSLASMQVLIGSHSYSHKVMTRLEKPEAEEEFIKSKKSLEALSGRKVELFSFPYGAFNSDLIKQASEAGYKRVFTSNYEVTSSEMNAAVVGRVRVDASDSLLEFRLKILGAYEWLNHIMILKEKFLCSGKSIQPVQTPGEEIKVRGQFIEP